MPHVLIAGRLHPSGLALLNDTAGVTYDYVEDVAEQSYAPLIGKTDALVIRTQPLSAETVARAERLKIVSRHGVGYDAVDLNALNARRIPLCVVGDVNSASVAEHAMMLILACAKFLVRADRSMRGGLWDWRNKLEADGGRLWHGDTRLRSVPGRSELASGASGAGRLAGGGARLGRRDLGECAEGGPADARR
jgi:D-3-phosphoglycerate dehydrogenase / 2-oxoglutarate reductase